jgi:biopolymer transport protein ExbD
MAGSSVRNGELTLGINITPMVDVVLVLLIVLMVTTSHAVSSAIRVDLPKAATGTSSDPSPLAISITESGSLFLNGKALTREQLRVEVRTLAADSRLRAIISADGGTDHRSVVGVIDMLRGEGLAKFAINVAPEELKP